MNEQATPHVGSTRPKRRRWPSRVAFWVGVLGQVLVGAGLLILLYVGYLLVGTSSVTKAAQHDAEKQLKAAPVVTQAQTQQGEIPAARPATPPALGQPLFAIVVPKIALRSIVVQGVEEPQLKLGPGHFADAPYPGEPGNVPISGHRTTYGAPFFNLDKLEPGDQIAIESGPARYKYTVSEKLIVRPTQYEVVENRGRNELTLTTCHPRFSAAQRLVIHANYDGAELIQSGPAPAPAPGQPSRSEAPVPNQPIPVDVFVLAGVAVACVLASMALSRRLRLAAIYGSVAAVTGVVMWIAVFPTVVKLMPANY